MNNQRPDPEQSIPVDAAKVFTGKLFDVYQWPQKLFNGKIATFEQIRRPDSVNVLPITGEGKIALVEVTFEEYLDIVAQDNYRDTEISLKLLKLARHTDQLEATKQAWLEKS